MLFSPSLVYWLSPSFFTGNKFSGPRAPPSHLGPKRSFLHERGEGTTGEQRDVWEGRRRPTPSRRTSIHKCPLPSRSLKLSWRERKRKEKKTDCTVSHTVYSSFVNTYIDLYCIQFGFYFSRILRELLWQVKKNGSSAILADVNKTPWSMTWTWQVCTGSGKSELTPTDTARTYHMSWRFPTQCILSKKKKRKKERKKSKVCGEFTWWKKKHHTLFSFLLFLYLSPHSWVGSLWDGDDLNFVLSSTFYF